MTKWYTLADNYEAEILGYLVVFQVITAAGILNLGGEFRATWARNLTFVVFFFGLLAWAVALVVTDTNVMTCFFRLNCKSPGLDGWNPSFYVPEYSSDSRTGSNVIPSPQRYQLLAILLANGFANWCYQYFGILGRLRRFLRRVHPLEKPNLPL
jgi:cation-transporting ATPase 13A3/4/5